MENFVTQQVGFHTARMTIQSWNEMLRNKAERNALVREVKGVLSPAVLQHLPEPLQLLHTQDAIKDWIAERAEESDVLLVRGHAEDELLGLLILATFVESDGPTTVHIGYLLAESAWGNGFATELIAGLVTWYKNEGRPVQLLGGVGANNSGSARVLQKNGFELVEELSNSTTEMFRLSIC